MRVCRLPAGGRSSRRVLGFLMFLCTSRPACQRQLFDDLAWLRNVRNPGRDRLWADTRASHVYFALQHLSLILKLFFVLGSSQSGAACVRNLAPGVSSDAQICPTSDLGICRSYLP